MHQPCPHCDQPDSSLLRLVLTRGILRANAAQLVLLVDVMQTCGLLSLTAEAEESEAARVRPQKGTAHVLRRPGADDQ